MNIAYKFIHNSALNADESKRDICTFCRGQLFAAKYDSLNDPFECSVRYETETLKNDLFKDNIISLIYSAGIYSLCKSKVDVKFPNDELMWAHYANSHKGFCIAFDLDNLINATPIENEYDLIDCLEVEYNDNSPIIHNSDSQLQIRQKLFAKKSKAWKKENEIRLIFKTAGLKSIPEEAIIAVYFGLNLPLDERTAIMESLAPLGIDFYQMEVIPTLYKLKATKVTNIMDIEILKIEHRLTVDNLTILYKSEAKDKQTLENLIKKIRIGLTRPTNINVVDNIECGALMEKYPYNEAERKILSEHWIAMSTFDAPDYVMYYPERD